MSLARKDQTVSDMANAVDLGAPTATWLRNQGYSAKRVARVIDASEATGKRLRSGVAPTTEQVAKLSRHFGWKFVEFIFQDLLGPPSDAELAADLQDIRRRLERLEAR